MNHRLYLGDCLEVLKTMEPAQCLFADPPDNINLGYGEYDDTKSYLDYTQLLFDWLCLFTEKAPIVWFSFNAKWTAEVGSMVHDLVGASAGELEFKPCVQVFTFGQHRKTDLGNNHRPLWRLRKKDAPLYPEQIKVPSWRQRNGDKRAASGGRVPGDVFDMQYPYGPLSIRAEEGEVTWTFPLVEMERGVLTKITEPFVVDVQAGDVFDFPRVTGNSSQRCDWHPTQLHEELVERCVLMSTKDGDLVIDPFGGTGTTLRVCKKLKRPCTLVEIDATYCEKIAEDNGMAGKPPAWTCQL